MICISLTSVTYHRITPVLRELHWLPITERVKFKLACLVHRWLSGQSPAYLADDCRLVSDSTCRSLRSADVPTCVVPRTYNSYGDRTFAAAGPRLWNSLPVQLRNPDISYGRFRRQLKGHLFGNDEHGAPWPSICSAIENVLLIYLHIVTSLHENFSHCLLQSRCWTST